MKIVKNKSFQFLVVIVSIFTINDAALAKEQCSIYNAQYKPHEAYSLPGELPKKKSKYTFEMTIKEPSDEERGGSQRSIFFEISAFDPETKEKISTIRLSDSCSNGTVTCSLNTYQGQFSTTENMKDLKQVLSFDVVALRKDYFRTSYNGTEAPYVIILPNTAREIGSYYRPSDPNYISTVNDFVHFYSTDNIFPDFSGYDIWIRSACGRK